jgi:hypothetical protein
MPAGIFEALTAGPLAAAFAYAVSFAIFKTLPLTIDKYVENLSEIRNWKWGTTYVNISKTLDLM